MGILQDALESLESKVSKAFDFADAETYIQEAEKAFKASIADAFEALSERVTEVEKTRAALSAPAETPPAPPVLATAQVTAVVIDQVAALSTAEVAALQPAAVAALAADAAAAAAPATGS